MSKNSNNKGLRKNKSNLTKKDLLPAHTPLFPVENKIRNLRVSVKQKEIIEYLKQGFNPSSIARLRNVRRQSINSQLLSLEKKGLLIKDSYKWIVTKLANQYLDFLDQSLGVGKQGTEEIEKSPKGRHFNNFHVNINKNPSKYKSKEFWEKQCNEFKAYVSTKQIIVKFDWGTGVISYGTNKLSLYFNEVSGLDYENIELAFFDIFVEKFKFFENIGFELDNYSLNCSKPHYHNKAGIFAHMCNAYTGKGFKVKVGEDEFWVDYSDGENSEEETNSYEIAKKIEKFGDSVVNNDVDMYDLQDLKEIVSGLVKRDVLRERIKMSNMNEFEDKGADYFG